MILEDIQKEKLSPVVIYGPCEILTCKTCGREYPSRGKDDPGYCRDCEEAMTERHYNGGPLDGQVAT